MDQTRRGVLGVLAGATAATVVTKGAVGSAPPAMVTFADPRPLAIPLYPNFPFGYMVDSFELAPMFSPTMALHVRKIFDGSQFVRFDSPEGTAVLNQLLQGLRAKA